MIVHVSKLFFMILILAGAGASVAISPESHPTTLEFFRRLPQEIVGRALFVHAVNFFRASTGNDAVDVEQVLSALSDLREASEAWRDNSRFTGWLLADNRTPPPSGSTVDLRPIHQMFSSTHDHVQQGSEASERQTGHGASCMG